MFNSTLIDFDLGLLQDQPTCTAICNDFPSITKDVPTNIMEQPSMEEMEKLGWLEATSDLQAFMDIGALPEIKGDQEVENVMNEVEQFLQHYDGTENIQTIIGDAPAISEEDLGPEEMSAAEDLLDELLKSADINLDELQSMDDSGTSDLNAKPTVEVKQEVEEKYHPLNDSGFIDMTNVTKVVTSDGKEIYIMIAPPNAKEDTSEITAETSDDSDWTPDSPKTVKGRPPVHRASKAKSGRKAPYIKDKKERKKQQNVEAARRYRDKKKAEMGTTETEEQGLTSRNKELKSQVAELEAEVKTMKKLMSELGMIKA